MEKKWIIMPWISMNFLLIGMLMCFSSEFRCGVKPFGYILPCMFISAVVLFIVLQLKKSYAVVAAAVGVLCTMIIVSFEPGRLRNDFLAIVYYINKRSMAYCGDAFIGLDGVRGNLNHNLTLTMLQAFLAAFIALAAFRLHSRSFGFLPVYIVLAAGLCVGRAPDKRAIFITVIGIVLALGWISQQEGGGRNYFRQKRVAGTRNKVFSYAVLLVLFTAGVLLAQFFERKTNEKILSHSDDYLEGQHKMERRVAGMAEQVSQYVSRTLGLGGVDNDGELSNEKPYYMNRTIIEVTTQTKPTETLYFKGFVGGEYQNGKWIPCDNQSLMDLFPDEGRQKWLWNLSYDFVEREFEFRSENLLASEHKERAQTAHLLQMRMDYVGFGKIGKYAYLPYYTDVFQICGDSSEPGVQMDGENGFRRNGMSYSVNCYNLGEGQYDVLQRLDNNYWQSSAYLSSRELDVYYEYVRERYGALPLDSLSSLKKLAGAYEYGKNALAVAKGIQRKLSRMAVYSQELQPVPEGKDYVEYFLETQKRGYCEHFATAGTLLMRAKGIPARYVSGYKVLPERFVRNKDGTYTAQIQDSDAHAWTEVFVGYCLGWYPVEMTPGASAGTGRSSSAAAGHGQDTAASPTRAPTPQAAALNEAMEPAQTPTATATASASSQSNQDDGKAEPGEVPEIFIKILIGLFWCAVALLIFSILAVIYQRHQVQRYNRRMKESGKSRNAAILIRIDRFLYFLRRCGAGGSRAKLCGDGFEVARWERVDDIIQKARFSGDSVSTEEYEFLCETIRKAEQTFFAKLSGKRIKYLRVIGIKLNERGEF